MLISAKITRIISGNHLFTNDTSLALCRTFFLYHRLWAALTKDSDQDFATEALASCELLVGIAQAVPKRYLVYFNYSSCCFVADRKLPAVCCAGAT